MTRPEGGGPLVSLLVPVYNRSDLLGACLDSALAQTMTDFEVVVVDGASTDDTWQVCQRYAAADPRIHVVREDVNSGPVPGWWRCVTEASGRYATFLWSDDLLMPTFLETTLPFVERDHVAFAYTAAEIGPMPGDGVIAYSRPSGPFPSQTFIDGSLPGTGAFPVSPACALFRLSDIRESFCATLPADPPIDFSATGAGTDLLLYLLTADRYPLVVSIAEPLAFFRSHPGSITVQGRGGQVALGYALAEAWFARKTGRAALGRAILARQWIVAMGSSRTFIGARAAARRFHRLVKPSELVAAAPRQAIRMIREQVESRVRRRRTGVPAPDGQ